MEHRWGVRIPIDLQVHLACRNVSTRFARLTDLSLSGAAIQSGFDLNPLALVQVTFEAELTPIAGYVVRREKGLVGIEWCDFSPRGIARIIKALWKPGCTSLPSASDEFDSSSFAAA